ncbi:MAG: hypothetical protein R2830_04980 [Saprospiraceae bacterium]
MVELLGVSEQVQYNWKSKENGLSASENSVELKAAREEAEQLRKRMKEAERERDIGRRPDGAEPGAGGRHHLRAAQRR